MKRYLRRLVLPAGLAAVLSCAIAGLSPNTASAKVPEYQRVIKSRSADAALVTVSGCVRTEVFASSSDNVFGGRPGPVNKQGLTGVLVRQIRTCAEGGARVAAVPPVGEVIFDGIGQTLDPLRSNPHFDRAWINASIPVLDEVSGRTVLVRLDLSWSLVGEFDRDITHTHVRVAHGAIVNSHAQTLFGDAVVEGTVTIDDNSLVFGPTEDGHLQQVKYGCQVIRHPHGDADLAC